MTDELAADILEVLDSRTPAVLVTVVSSSSEFAGYPVGLKTVIHAGGRADPDLPAGPLAGSIRATARQALSAGHVRLEQFAADGTSIDRRAPARRTAGFLHVYFEPLAPVDRLIIVGAGHIAIPICQIASILGFEVTVLDDRSDYASAERFPEAVEVIAADFAPALAGLTIDASTYIILVTRAHAFDEQALQQIAASDARYIGMIGSRRRVLIVHQNLIAAGVSPDALHKVYAPLGIDLGAESVEEIALAAVAEVVNVKRGGRAQSLRIDAWGDSIPAVAEPAD